MVREVCEIHCESNEFVEICKVHIEIGKINL